MFKPLLPIISDILSHDFNEAIHISTIHAIYGSNHLEKEMAATSENDNNKNQTTVKYEEPVPVHIHTEKNIAFVSLTNNVKPSSCFSQLRIPVIFLSIHLPPPKYC